MAIHVKEITWVFFLAWMPKYKTEEDCPIKDKYNGK
jgi:hypothetical protein